MEPLGRKWPPITMSRLVYRVDPVAATGRTRMASCGITCSKSSAQLPCMSHRRIVTVNVNYEVSIEGRGVAQKSFCCMPIPITEHADSSKRTQYCTQRWLCREWTDKHTGQGSSHILGLGTRFLYLLPGGASSCFLVSGASHLHMSQCMIVKDYLLSSEGRPTLHTQLR